MQFLKDQYPQYDIGDYTYGGLIIDYHDGGSIKIGKFCSFAMYVIFVVGGQHPFRRIVQYPVRMFVAKERKITESFAKGPLVIENDVWIGVGAIILNGLTVGNGAVIGAGSVVTKDIPPYAIAVGNPARVIGKRFDDETIEKLLEIKWWYWPDKKIERYVDELTSMNVDRLWEVYQNERS